MKANRHITEELCRCKDHVCDENGILMEVLLFIREGRVCMFEVLQDEEKKSTTFRHPKNLMSFL
jgi:hypothetical protein